MKTIINELTGKVICCILDDIIISLDSNEIIINDIPSGSFIIPYYNFIDEEFYEGATEEEIDTYNLSLIPKVVSQRQLRTQLVLDGFDLNTIQLAINDLDEPDKSIAQIAWDYAVVFERESPLLISLAYTLGLNDDSLNNIFINANQL